MAQQASLSLDSIDARLRDLEKRVDPQQTKPFMTSTGTLQVGVHPASTTRLADSIAEQAMGGVESLQAVRVGPTFNLGAVTTGTLSNDQLRPDPVLGEVYRITMAGSILTSGGVSASVTLQITLDGAAPLTIMTASVPPTTQTNFFGVVMVVITAGGVNGAFLLSSDFCQGNGATSFTAETLEQIGAYGPLAANLMSAFLTTTFTTGGLSAGTFFNVNSYIVESLGFRTG